MEDIKEQVKKTQGNSISKGLSKFLETTQNKSYFVAFVSFSFFGIFLFFGVIPAFNSVFSQIEENKVIDRETQNANEKLRTIQSMLQAIQDNQNLYNYFNQVFPEENNQEEVMQLIFDLANENDLDLKTATFTNDYRRRRSLSLDFRGLSPNVKSYGVNITLEGDRANLINYLKDLEETRRVINILNFSISKLSENIEGEFDFSSILTIEYYYYE